MASSQKNISVFVDERGIVIRILDKAFFDEGKADFKEKAKNALDKIVPVLKSTNNKIRIEGHTDNVPISNHEFRSNWELSVRRATEVVRYFIEKYDFSPERDICSRLCRIQTYSGSMIRRKTGL